MKRLFSAPLLFLLISCASKQNGMEDSASISSNCGTMNTAECEVFLAVNAQRQANGLAALKPFSTCVQMAKDHAQDMVVRNYFSHNSPTETFRQRVSRYGLSGYTGENIARGYFDTSVVQGWMNSTGHRANILNSNFVSGGIGNYEDHWVQCFSGGNGD